MACSEMWLVIDSVIPVVNCFRDQGSTLSVAASTSTQQSRKRLLRATRTLHRVFALPHDLPRKLVVLRATSINTALYSCEASHVDESALHTFSAQLAKHLAPQATKSSQAMVYTITSDHDDDPSVCIVVRRILMLRRMLTKWPHL